MPKTPQDILVHLAALENGINPKISTLKKEKGDLFSELCTESFKSKFLRYINKILFEMFKTTLKNAYLGETTPIELQNEVSTCRKI